MITKRNFNPVKIWEYVKLPLSISIIWSIIVWLIFDKLNLSFLAISFTPVGVLGSALAICVAFRNNSAYGRWWEARKLWDGLVNHSREFSRMTINFVDVCIRVNPDRKDEMNAFKKELIYRHIGFVNALRLHLRQQEDVSILQNFLTPEDYNIIKNSNNKPNLINMLNGDCLRKGQDNGMLEWFHTFQIEGNLTQFANHLGKCERIKNTPLPRQYDFFTRLFVTLFSIILPIGLLSFFQADKFAGFTWLVIPFSILISGVFIIMERSGAANEDPFENKVTDIPMTSLCNTIERDLKEMLGEKDLPSKLEPENGYLF